MGAADTPMMREYLELKKGVADALLFYRMGDFYELFFADAHEAAAVLELVVTSRNKGDPDPIPMAGFPYRALEPMLQKASAAGRRVAIAEQRETSPGVYVRELVRIVSAGLPFEGESIEAREPCYIAAFTDPDRLPIGLAVLDVTTGELLLMELAEPEALAAELERIDPKECLIADGVQITDALHFAVRARALSRVEARAFEITAGRRRLSARLGVADLSAFGAEGLKPALAAAGGLLFYAEDTARVRLGHLLRLRVVDPGGHLILDEAARRNLELLRPLRGAGRQGTLIHLLDQTCTPMGGRLLREWLLHPLIDLRALLARQAAVSTLGDGPLRAGLRSALSAVTDLARLGGKVAQERANARDLVALAASLRALPTVFSSVAAHPSLQAGAAPPLLLELAEDVERWLVPEPPAALTEGGLINPGVDAELDELQLLAREGRGAIAHIEAQEREASGIQSLKIKYNRVFGYFLEVSQSKLDRVPDRWIRKQTLSNCERFITPALKEFEDKVLGADERAKALEYARFVELRQRVAARTADLLALSAEIARIDVLATLAEVGVRRRWTLPAVDAGDVIDVQGGRHPVIEAMDGEEPFVPNDLVLSQDRRLVVLTGPNMAGKSTIMRQTALIVLLAQMGAPVPAEAARVGLCDRIFVRVGASDDLSRGRSTFMVEMAETALILHQATARSLVLLDEIGRGTSTFDGLSIAWATAEVLVDRVRARAIFATHYHELVALADDRPAVVNLHVRVSEWGDKIEFLRVLAPGGASKSYGLQCARLAGMPPDVLERAQKLLTELERRPKHGPPNRQLSLFSAPPAAAPPASAPPAAGAPPAAAPPTVAAPPDPALLALREAVLGVPVDDLSPRAALERLYALQALARAPAPPRA
jgi:DNA mismatch repair protein MutS